MEIISASKLLIVIFQIIFFSVCEAFLGLKIKISNNGPIVTGANITFHAELQNFHKIPFLKWTWEDTSNPPVKVIQENGGLQANLSWQYKTKGSYKMKVTVTELSLPLASGQSEFEIQDCIPGHVEVWQYGNLVPPKKYISTNNETEIILKLHDPSDFLKNASMFYAWSIDSLPLTGYNNNSLSYQFTQSGIHLLLLTVIAYIPEYGYREGSYPAKILAGDPINYINVTGNTMLRRGDLVDMYVECGGSAPWNYCWRPVFPTEGSTDNITCDDIQMTNDCEFTIIYYFGKTGHYQIFINITNDVDAKIVIKDISIYNVLPEPQLSTVIIPVVCSLLAVAIIVVGVLYYIQARQRLTIEVADFDFTESDSFTYRTFYEQLKQAIMDALPSDRIIERQWSFLDCINDRTNDNPPSTTLIDDDISSTHSSEIRNG